MKNAHGDLARKVMIARAALSGPATARHLFADLTMDVPDPGPALAWIVAHDPDDARARRACDTMKVPAFRATPAMREVVEDALQDPEVPVDRMVRLWFGARFGGLDIDFVPGVADSEVLLDTVARHLAEMATPTFAGLTAGLTDVHIASPASDDLAARFDLARRLGLPHGPSLLVVLAMVGVERAHDAEECADALRRAAASRDPKAANLLREIVSWPGLGGLQSVVDESVREVADVAGPPWDVGELHRVIVSGADGDGMSLMSVVHEDADGLAPTFTTVLGPGGIELASPSALHEPADAEREMPPRSVKAPFALAKSLAQEALLHHVRAGRPLPGGWVLAGRFLGELKPAPHVPNLSAYRPVRADASESGRLLRCRPFQGWACRSAEAFAFIRDHGPHEAHFPVYLRDICCAPAERARLLRSFAGTLELESLAGRAGDAVNRIAWRTYLALAEGIPMERMEFVVELAAASMVMVGQWVRDGFRSAEEVFDAEFRRRP